MRRALLIALAAPALLLAACGDDAGTDGTADVSDPATTAAVESAEDTTEASATSEDAATTSESGAASADAAATSGDAASSTAGGVEGGADGQAAADVAKSFFMTMVKADPKACDHLLSFTDTERPMKDVKEDYEMCVEVLPPVLEKEIQAQGLDEEGAQILEAMRISGADVQGTTAVVDKDNFSPIFADIMGEEAITLKKIDGEWYIDLDRSFQGTGTGK